MSKIEKALERARQERGEAASQQVAPRATARPRSEGACVFPEVPKYSTTEVFALDRAHLHSHRIMHGQDNPRVKDAYDVLRTRVLQLTRQMGWNSLMITSVGPGVGKTVTAINLALSMAREVQQTALLVDCNFRNPSVCAALGLDPGRKGLADHLVDDACIPGLLVNPGVDKLVILPAGSPLPDSADLLGGPKMKHLVSELKSKYPDRYVLYDCPHILDMPDSLVFSSFVDAVLLVAAAGETDRKDLTRAVQLLEGKPILGIVMNKAGRPAAH